MTFSFIMFKNITFNLSNSIVIELIVNKNDLNLNFYFKSMKDILVTF